MPVGELAALASSVTFAFTAIVDKSLTRRFRPLSLAAFSSLGGALFALILLFALGKAREMSSAPFDSLLLSMGGGVISIGIGVPLYLIFLRSVDVSKAAPLSTGLFVLLSVLAGVFILGEGLSLLTLVGIVTLISGLYVLSFSQRKQVGPSQARWLGVKGALFLVFVATLWVTGTSLQTVALRDLDVFIANGVRLFAVFAILATLASLGLGRNSWRQNPEATSRDRGGLRNESSRARTFSSGPRHQTALSRMSLERFGHPRLPHLPIGRGWRDRRRVALQIRPPVDWAQIKELEDELSRLGATVEKGRPRHDGNGVLLYVDLPRAYSLVATMAAMSTVAASRQVGRWPRSQRIELTLRSPATAAVPMTGGPGGPSPASAPRIREVRLEQFSFVPCLIPVINGSVSFGLGSLLMLIALEKTGIAITMVLTSTQLLWITLLSTIFLRERLTFKTILGVVVTAVGVVLVVL